MASCGPLVISYVAGTEKNIGKGLAAYAIFSLSRISTYLILALAIFFLGHFAVERFAGEYSRYISIAGGLFIIFVGMIMVLGRHFDFGLLKKAQKITLGQDTKSVILFGLIIGFLPCAPLIAILSFVGLVSKNWLTALLYGFSFGLGTFISPLILLVVITGLIPGLFSRNDGLYRRLFNIACGLVIIFLGVRLIYGGVY
jgi:sulfite exporter TauE/SafE